jgi:hypothetical protein
MEYEDYNEEEINKRKPMIADWQQTIANAIDKDIDNMTDEELIDLFYEKRAKAELRRLAQQDTP